jgi:hypothetical protein
MNQYEELRAGALTATLDRFSGQLRWLRYGPHEVLRGIYGAVRDQHWNTITPEIELLAIERGANELRIEFHAVCRKGEIDFRWRGSIVGSAESVIRYCFAGKAYSAFLRNRIGLCVLHPIRECAGQPCSVLHTDGTTEHAEFPLTISAQQPFMRIAALRHRVTNDVDAEVRFVGDTFETEDQRNWTDASFKTYSTPLDLPFPVAVRPGDVVHQEVEVKLLGRVSPLPSNRLQVISLSAGSAVSLPLIGFSHLGRATRLDEEDAVRLTKLRPRHLRVELNANEAGFLEDLIVAADDARRLNASMQVVLDFASGDESEVTRVLTVLQPHTARVAEWVVLQNRGVASPHLSQLVRRTLAQHVSLPRIGLGSNDNFTELNRDRPAIGAADFLTYAVNPQAHAFDNATIVENLVGQAETVRTAKEFAGETSLHVGPITLKRRMPTRSLVESVAASAEMPMDADARQVSPFLAGWTLGSIAALSQEGVHAATYFELTGCRGVAGAPSQAHLPAPFGPSATAVFPVYHVFADIAELEGGNWHVLSADMSDAVFGLLCRRAGGSCTLVANPTDRTWTCRLPIAPQRLRMLDQTTAASAMHSPTEFRAAWQHWTASELELPPQSYVRVEETRS